MTSFEHVYTKYIYDRSETRNHVSLFEGQGHGIQVGQIKGHRFEFCKSGLFAFLCEELLTIYIYLVFQVQ